MSILAMLYSGCHVDMAGVFGFNPDADARFNAPGSRKPYADMTALPPEWSFIAVSDVHVKDSGHSNLPSLSVHVGSDDRLLLIAGDLVNNGGQDGFDIVAAKASAAGLPVRTALGNHDAASGGYSAYLDTFQPSVYYFYAGGVRFIVLDTASGTLGRLQWEWLNAFLALDGVMETVVMTHFNFFTPGGHAVNEFYDAGELYSLMALLKRYGTRTVLMGHDHTHAEWRINGVTFVCLPQFRDEGSDPRFARFTVSNSQVTGYSLVPLY